MLFEQRIIQLACDLQGAVILVCLACFKQGSLLAEFVPVVCSNEGD